MSEVDERTATAYDRALAAARAALLAGPEDAAKAARDELLAVTDPAELMRVAGALAWLAVYRIPASVRQGRSVPSVLDRVHLEMLMGAS